MQDPKAIIQQAKSGAAPTDWFVARPEQRFPALAALRAGCLTFALLFAVGVVAFIVLAIVELNLSLAPLQQAEVDYFTAIYSGPLLLGIGAIIVIMAVIGGIRAIRNAPWSFLVITHEGMAQSLGPSSITSLDFAEISDITRRTDTQVYRSPLQYQRYTQNYVALHYRDGRGVRSWTPNWRFGDDEHIVFLLDARHALYLRELNRK
jgi:hypothetical protein